MYIVTRRGLAPSVYSGLAEAVRAATQVTDPPCWIWRLEVSRLGTLKRIEVAREEIQGTGVENIWCIQNRFERDAFDPVDGQLFFSQSGGELQILEYRQGGASRGRA
jgi:hypothetical protein